MITITHHEPRHIVLLSSSLSINFSQLPFRSSASPFFLLLLSRSPTLVPSVLLLALSLQLEHHLSEALTSITYSPYQLLGDTCLRVFVCIEIWKCEGLPWFKPPIIILVISCTLHRCYHNTMFWSLGKNHATSDHRPGPICHVHRNGTSLMGWAYALRKPLQWKTSYHVHIDSFFRVNLYYIASLFTFPSFWPCRLEIDCTWVTPKLLPINRNTLGSDSRASQFL